MYVTLLSEFVLTGLDSLIVYAQTELNRIASVVSGTGMWSFIVADLLLFVLLRFTGRTTFLETAVYIRRGQKEYRGQP